MDYTKPVKKMSILIAAIKMKVARGEDLDTILEAYVNLTKEEKDLIRNAFEK